MYPKKISLWSNLLWSIMLNASLNSCISLVTCKNDQMALTAGPLQWLCPFGLSWTSDSHIHSVLSFRCRISQSLIYITWIWSWLNMANTLLVALCKRRQFQKERLDIINSLRHIYSSRPRELWGRLYPNLCTYQTVSRTHFMMMSDKIPHLGSFLRCPPPACSLAGRHSFIWKLFFLTSVLFF